MQRPTLATLARELGVSHQTVSNVINAPHKVKRETRERVDAAIEATGYRPSAAARALRTNRSMNIGCRIAPVNDGINGAVMDRFLHRLVVESLKHGMLISLFSSATPAREVRDLADAHRRTGIDAAVLTDTFPADPRPARLHEFGIPFVAFGRPWGQPRAPHSWVDVDGAVGSRLAVAHLKSLGHSQIGFIGWPTGSGVGEDRHAGWAKAMGKAFDTERYAVRGADSIEQGARAATTLLRRGATAFVCTSDSFAIGAGTAVRSKHPTPGALAAIVGFDDTPVVKALGLSSMSQPVEDAATLIIGRLVAELSGAATAAPLHALLPPVLRARVVESFVTA